MTITASYDEQLSRVRVSISAAPTGSNAMLVERSIDQISWRTVRGGATAALTSGTATVDDYEFEPNTVNHYRATPLLFENFESAALDLDATGTWARDDSTSATGRWSYRSAEVGGNESSEVDVTVPAAALTLAFAYRVSSENGFDLFEFLRDGSSLFDTSGDVPWAETNFDVSAAATVTFRYIKDTSVTEGIDAAWIDDVRFTFATETASITPTLDTVWLKFLAKPFLNRAVTVTEFGDVERPSRNGIFSVVGRSYPIAVTELRGSRRYTLTVMQPTIADAQEFDYVLASGEPVLVHVPPDCPVPGMYAVIGDVTMTRVMPRSPRRYFELPLIETAAPAPEIVGATVTWQSIVNTFATWSDLLAAEASWADVTERIGAPEEVIVP